MAALRQPNPEPLPDPLGDSVGGAASETEVLYLVIPPDATRLNPPPVIKPGSVVYNPTLAERLSELAFDIQHGLALNFLKKAFDFSVIAVLTLCALGVGLYGLYIFKSFIGIDIFPDKHLEDFVPIPGYRRW